MFANETRRSPQAPCARVQQQKCTAAKRFRRIIVSPPLEQIQSIKSVFGKKKNCKQKDKLENVLKAWQGTGPGPWPRGRENSRSRAAQTRATPARGRARGNRHSAELTGARATQKKGGETDNTARERQEQTSHQRAAHRQNKCAADGSV